MWLCEREFESKVPQGLFVLHMMKDISNDDTLVIQCSALNHTHALMLHNDIAELFIILCWMTFRLLFKAEVIEKIGHSTFAKAK